MSLQSIPMPKTVLAITMRRIPSGFEYDAKTDSFRFCDEALVYISTILALSRSCIHIYVLEAFAGVCLSVFDDDHGALVCFLYDYVIAFAELF